MRVMISTFSQTPIYEQIREQIKEEILKGRLQANEQLPSIRLLASDLKVGIVTVKRAYHELEREGIIVNVQGKGCFVRELNQEEIHKQHCLLLSQRLLDIKDFSKQYAIPKEEVWQLMEDVWRENDE